MDDDWSFWMSQLAGENPETTPGTPHAGYYLLRRRISRPNDDPNRKPGDPRRKVETTHLPVAIWNDGGWHMVIGREEHYRDVDQIDETFSRCCRNAITYDEYQELTHVHERTD
jgi:hypothetical protein